VLYINRKMSNSLIYKLLKIIFDIIISSQLSAPLEITTKYINNIGTIPGGIFLCCICGISFQIVFNLYDFFKKPEKQESKEIREPLINNAGLYLYITCFFMILFDQIIMLSVNIIVNMSNSLQLISEYSNHLTSNSLSLLNEIKRNFDLIENANDNNKCLLSLKNNIQNHVTLLSSRIDHFIRINNNYIIYKDRAFKNAEKYNSNQASLYTIVAFFYVLPIIIGALYVYCHHYRLIKYARWAVHFGCIWFIIMSLGSSAWFFVTIFLSKLCNDPNPGFAALVAYFSSDSSDNITGDMFIKHIEYYSSCNNIGALEESLLSISHSTSNLYEIINNNSCSTDKSITDMKLYLQLILRYYDSWAKLVNCKDIKSIFYDDFIETKVCHNLFVGSGTFWFSQNLSVLCLLLAIAILSYAYKVYDSDKFDENGNLIKLKKKRRRIKWYDRRDVSELKKKLKQKLKENDNENNNNENNNNDNNNKDDNNDNDNEDVEKNETTSTIDIEKNGKRNENSSDDESDDEQVEESNPNTIRWPTMMNFTTPEKVASENSDNDIDTVQTRISTFRRASDFFSRKSFNSVTPLPINNEINETEKNKNNNNIIDF